MATLHLVSASQETSAALSNCLHAASPGDSVVLIGNGVFNANSPIFRAVLPAQEAAIVFWYALADDITARGIGSHVDSAITLVDDFAFVDLVAAHQPIVSWS